MEDADFLLKRIDHAFRNLMEWSLHGLLEEVEGEERNMDLFAVYKKTLLESLAFFEKMESFKTKGFDLKKDFPNLSKNKSPIPQN